MKEYKTLTREKVDVVPFGCGMPETHLMQDWGDKMLDMILNGPTINGIKKDEVRAMLRETYAFFLYTSDQSREDKTREGNTPPSPSDEGNDGGTKSLVEVRFLEFWKAYPKKTGKQYALKAWNKSKPTAELHERIMQAVDAQKRSDQWRRENGRYIPNPSTWLNGGYWANEEVKEGAENQRDPEQPDSSGRDWGKGFKPADDCLLYTSRCV